MKQHITRRKINGKWYSFQDIGCDDFDRAKRNREARLPTTFYDKVEKAVRGTPLTSRLPLWIPRGELPQVDIEDLKQNSGGGFYVEELVDPEVVNDLTDPLGGVV